MLMECEFAFNMCNRVSRVLIDYKKEFYNIHLILTLTILKCGGNIYETACTLAQIRYAAHKYSIQEI